MGPAVSAYPRIPIFMDPSYQRSWTLLPIYTPFCHCRISEGTTSSVWRTRALALYGTPLVPVPSSLWNAEHNHVGARVQALTRFTPVYPNALILVEPTVMFPSMSPTDPRSIHGAANVRGALAKRDRWPSRAEFKRWLATSGKSIWGRWDPRVLDLYVVRACVRRDETSPDEMSFIRNMRLKR